MSPAASELKDPGFCSEHGLRLQSKDKQVGLIGESELSVGVSLSSICRPSDELVTCPGCTSLSAWTVPTPQTMTQFGYLNCR